MRSSIYDALEVNSSAPVNAIQVALRGVVRRFWAVPRDASGDSEEAVRFAALGASILVDPVRRKDYDAALNPGVGAGPWRLPIGSQSHQDGSTNSRVLGEGSVEPSQLLIEAAPPKALPGVDALAEPLPDGKAWGSPLIFVAMVAAAVLLWYACTLGFTDTVPRLAYGEALLVAVGLSAVIVAVSMWLGRTQEPPSAAANLSRLAIIKWRREGSIFIGVPPPQHDTAWIFKLRLMELTRSAAGFVTATSALRRTVARLVDYALVALLVYFGITAVDALVTGFDLWFIAARSPVLLPVLAVLLAIPLEAFFYRAMRTTPGKWLFGLMPVLGTTRPADHQSPSDTQLAWARAAGAAWSGATLGFWPLALLRLPRNLKLASNIETNWESRGDSVMMARPLAPPAVATGLIIVVATTLILISGWRSDYVVGLPQAQQLTAGTRSWLADLLNFRSVSSPVATPSSVPPAAEVATPPTAPAPTATVVQTPAPSVESAPPAKTPPIAIVPQPPVVAKTSAETEMSKQANAAHARRLKIDGYVRQAESARRSGNYGGLQGSCQNWAQEQPGNAEAWRCLGLAQYQNGAGREALPALRQALKLEPNDSQVESAILKILRP